MHIPSNFQSVSEIRTKYSPHPVADPGGAYQARPPNAPSALAIEFGPLAEEKK